MRGHGGLRQKRSSTLWRGRKTTHDVLSDNGSVHAGRVRLLADRLLVRELALRAVARGVVLRDVLLDVARDGGGNVLVVGVDLLLVAEVGHME